MFIKMKNLSQHKHSGLLNWILLIQLVLHFKQDTFSFSCPASHPQHPQVLFSRAALNLFIPQPVLIPGVVPTQVQQLAFSLKPHETPMGPLLELVQVPLDATVSSSGMSTAPLNLVSSANFLRVYLISLSMSLMKILTRTGPSTDSWGTALVTDIHWHLSHWLLPPDATIQPIPYPPNSPTMGSISLQFRALYRNPDQWQL